MNKEVLWGRIFETPYIKDPPPLTKLELAYYMGEWNDEFNCMRLIQVVQKEFFGVDLPDLRSGESFLYQGRYVARWDGDPQKFYHKLRLGDVVYADPFVLPDVSLSVSQQRHLLMYLGTKNGDWKQTFFAPFIPHVQSPIEGSAGNHVLLHAHGGFRNGASRPGVALWTDTLVGHYYEPVAAKRF